VDVDTADDVSLRSTALMVLALVGSHPSAATDIATLGWALRTPSTGDANTMGTGLAPAPLVAVPHLSASAYTLVDSTTMPGAQEAPPLRIDDIAADDTFLSARRLPPLKPEWELVLTKLTDLGSRITQKEARTWLVRAKENSLDLFASPQLYMHTHALLSRYNMPLAVRRFIHSLFDRVSFSDKAWEHL
jgi:hypothetical protein